MTLFDYNLFCLNIRSLYIFNMTQLELKNTIQQLACQRLVEVFDKDIQYSYDLFD